MGGPLQGITVIELKGLGPGPFGAMVLADLGARVIRIDRADESSALPTGADLMGRSRESVAVDLKQPEGRDLVLRMIEGSDVLIEGFRPGVAERLGVGPDTCLGRNPRLVYARVTGWGQDGPLAARAGHDIDYLALAGGLDPIGPPERPSVPLNLIGDFGGGGMLLATGVLAALVERAASGVGQVVDAAMVDGVALLMTLLHGMRAVGLWEDRRGANLLDGGTPFYDVYQTSDGRFMAVGALEPQFFAELLAGLGLDPGALTEQYDPSGWPALRRRITEVFASRTQAHWTEVFSGRDACVAPVLTMGEAPDHPQLAARETFVTIEGITQPAPAPRFSRTPADEPRLPNPAGHDTDDVLAGFGLSAGEIADLRAGGVVA